MSTLYVIASPIGNLKDITLRALEILKGVDLILCEDTRRTQKLLNRFGIKTRTLSYHQHSKLKKINYILELLRQGKDLALISDAGTPGISDPGNKLIQTIVTGPGLVVKIVPVPGPSALTAAASIAGVPMDKFLFLGFPPAKRKRKKYFEEVIKSKYPVIFYESPYRILKSLRDLRETDAKINAKPTRKIVVGRELTKKFEIIYRGTIEEIIEKIKKDKIKGEFVVIVENK
ncbi:16S rRNA (cytidine(1402)-2'-O)-methyltransferase [Patescibacteria group bacterium]|nr:16S rRNA (cytidine(1402)-2'-O)-methyltransferase [Patescibacteria group bacterium]